MTKLQELIEEREKELLKLLPVIKANNQEEEKYAEMLNSFLTEPYKNFLRETIDRTIELMEGCVPEEMDVEEGNGYETVFVGTGERLWNDCREQTLSNIKALKV